MRELIINAKPMQGGFLVEARVLDDDPDRKNTNLVSHNAAVASTYRQIPTRIAALVVAAEAHMQPKAATE